MGDAEAHQIADLERAVGGRAQAAVLVVEAADLLRVLDSDCLAIGLASRLK
jgi:hypothetical protein